MPPRGVGLAWALEDADDRLRRALDDLLTAVVALQVVEPTAMMEPLPHQGPRPRLAAFAEQLDATIGFTESIQRYRSDLAELLYPGRPLSSSSSCSNSSWSFFSYEPGTLSRAHSLPSYNSSSSLDVLPFGSSFRSNGPWRGSLETPCSSLSSSQSSLGFRHRSTSI
ncbi:unnamed protein product, partial [Mesorhabditis spiculigera]